MFWVTNIKEETNKENEGRKGQREKTYLIHVISDLEVSSEKQENERKYTHRRIFLSSLAYGHVCIAFEALGCNPDVTSCDVFIKLRWHSYCSFCS